MRCSGWTWKKVAGQGKLIRESTCRTGVKSAAPTTLSLCVSLLPRFPSVLCADCGSTHDNSFALRKASPRGRPQPHRKALTGGCRPSTGNHIALKTGFSETDAARTIFHLRNILVAQRRSRRWKCTFRGSGSCPHLARASAAATCPAAAAFSCPGSQTSIVVATPTSPGRALATQIG